MHPELKYVSNHRYLVKLKPPVENSHAVTVAILEHHWESADRRSNLAPIVLPKRKMKNVLTKLHDELSGGHLVVNSTLKKV